VRQWAVRTFNILLEASLYLLPVFFLLKRSYATSIYVWIAGFFCLSLLLKGRRPRFSSPVTVIVLLFVLSVVIPSIFTIGMGNTWREGKHFLYGVTCFFILVDQCRVRPYLVKRYVFLLVILALFVSLDTLWQFHAGTDILGRKIEGKRMTSVFSNPNYLGFFLSGIPPFCFWMYDNSEKGWLKIIWGFCLYIIFFAIALSATRSALLAFALFLLFVLFLREKGHAFLLLPSLLVIPVILFLNGKVLWGRFMGMVHLHGSRMLIWDEAWHWIQKNPWLGNGLDSYKDTVPSLLYAGRKWHLSAPHNFFLEVWFAVGVVALLVFCMFLGKVIASHAPFKQKLAGRQGYLFAAFWMVFLSSFFSIPFFSRYVSFYFWLCLGLLFGAYMAESDGRGAEDGGLDVDIP